MLDISFLKLSALTIVGAAALLGFYSGRASRLVRLPSLIGYMVIGILLGPSVLNLLGEPVMEQLSFITEIALGFVAFSIGSELNLGSLKRLGSGIVSIILAESLAAFVVVTGAVFLLTRDLPMALIFGAMAPASAPAGTVAVIHEYRTKGPLTKALYAVVGFDDGLAIIIFGFAAAIAKSLLVGGASAATILPSLLAPLKEIGLSVLVGGTIGLAFTFLVRRLNSTREMLILIVGSVLLATGISIHWHLSLILTNMMAGFLLTNTRREAFVHRVVAPLHDIMPLMFVLFFCLAGAHLEIASLPALGLVGLVYIVARSGGLIGGARIGAMLGHVESNVKKYIGLGILSQAGVAIGLSLIVKQDLAQLDLVYGIPDAVRIGAAVLTTITASSIVFEIVGPILTRFALRRAGEIPDEPRSGPTDSA